jgi:hypothetical protein
MRDEFKQVREYSSMWPDRPRVYFEEWHDPLIAGIRWVSELIEIAGGRDVFAELARAAERQGPRGDSGGGRASAIRTSSSRRGVASPSTIAHSRRGPGGRT